MNEGLSIISLLFSLFLMPCLMFVQDKERLSGISHLIVFFFGIAFAEAIL